jgi:hypothetical protein
MCGIYRAFDYRELVFMQNSMIFNICIMLNKHAIQNQQNFQ